MPKIKIYFMKINKLLNLFYVSMLHLLNYCSEAQLMIKF